MKLKRVKRDKFNPMQMMKEKRALADKIEDDLKEQGVKFFKPNDGLNISSDFLELPSNLTEVSSRHLGEYLNAFTQQSMYMKTLLGWAECYLEDSRREYFEASADRYRELLNTKFSETAKEREINTDPSIRPYYENFMESKAKINILKSNIESIESAIFSISREVSRRTGDYNLENRTESVQRK